MDKEELSFFARLWPVIQHMKLFCHRSRVAPLLMRIFSLNGKNTSYGSGQFLGNDCDNRIGILAIDDVMC
jgi:hypothetical protein